MKKALLISYVLLVGVGQTGHAVLIHQESFEQPSNGMNYVVLGEHNATSTRYFYRGRNSDFGLSFPEDLTNNVDGVYFFAGENTDGSGPGETRVTIQHLNVTPYQNIQVEIAVAALRHPGSAPGFEPDYEPADYIILQTGADGDPWTNIAAYRGVSAAGDVLREDTNLDGVGNGTLLNASFRDFTYNISGSPTSVQTRVLFLMEDSGEEAAYDNIRVSGDPIAPTITITNPPADAFIPTSATTVEINGTANRGVFGVITWSNDFNGASGTVPTAMNWSIAGIPVGLGVNAISVSGTNGVNDSTSDSVNITQIIRPTLDITDPLDTRTVAHTQTTANLSGVANAVVVGSLHWTNVQAEAFGTALAEANWSIIGVPLVLGTNDVTVTGTNIVSESTNDTVSIYQVPAPIVTISSPPDNSAVPHTQATVNLSGTVNGEVHGLLRWTNSLTGGTGTTPESDNWSINSIPLGLGTNVITVTGTNIVAQSANDSISVYQVPAPNVTITSPAENSAVPHTQPTIDLSGTVNGEVHGLLRWTNSLTGGSGTAAESDTWSINGIPLGLGTNDITVTGTNIVGQSDSDAVSVYQVPAPVLTITDPATDITVANNVLNRAVSGTANGVVSGTLTWTNMLTGGTGVAAAGTAWNVGAVPLGVGMNSVTVSGTNDAGVAAADTVNIAREGAILLNEVLANAVGPDAGSALEYVEILSLNGPGTISGLCLLEINGTGPSSGSVIDRWDLTGLSFGDNGLLTIGESYPSQPLGGPWSNLVSPHTLFGSPPGATNDLLFGLDITIALVSNCNAGVIPGTDLDLNNDGVLDVSLGETVLDSVGWSDGAVGSHVYSTASLVQPAGRPDAATRFQGQVVPADPAAWFSGDILTAAGDPLGRTYNQFQASANLPPGAVLTPGRGNYPFPNDQDNDGLPDDWEQEHFGSPIAASPDADDDNDGYTNRDEYWAGSNPTNASSFFMFDTFAPTGTLEVVVVNDETGVVLHVESMLLSWASFSNRVYTVYGQTNPASQKYLLDPRVYATPPMNSYLDPTNSTALRFYSIGVLEPLP
jgi:hypothetical protein